MRDLILRGGPWNDEEQASILDYCQSDVDALARLLPAMLRRNVVSSVTIGQTLLRGRSMAAAASMEDRGVPIDTATHKRLRCHWADIQDRLVASIDLDYGVYDGRSFKRNRFAAFLARTGIPWPCRENGELDLTDSAFREMARAYPVIAPLRELRYALSQLRLEALAVGSDGRNRTLLSAFKAKTGRTQRWCAGPSAMGMREAP